MVLQQLSIMSGPAMGILTPYWLAVASTQNSVSLVFPGSMHSYSIKRLALALVIGLFVGLEREWRHKQAGVRTFGFVALLGCLGALLGENYALLSIALLGILIVFLNLKTLRVGKGTELTTSTALLVMGLAGVLCGQGHIVTPVAVAVTTAALLSWKEPLKGFSLGLSEKELRSAIVLAMLTFVILPALPKGSIDPWGLVEPQSVWLTVILVAGIGFVNYVLWKIYGTRGIEVAGFLGGLVNSSVAVIELAKRVKETQGRLGDVAYRGIILAMAAMMVRNVVLLAILSPPALRSSALALALMLAAIMALTFVPRLLLVLPPSRPLDPAPRDEFWDQVDAGADAKIMVEPSTQKILGAPQITQNTARPLFSGNIPCPQLGELSVPVEKAVVKGCPLDPEKLLPDSSQSEETPPALHFESPFSLQSALKFGLIFLALQIGAVLAQKVLGQFGFYAISIVGGLISSASAVASAATLAAHGTLSANVAGTGAVLASIASALMNLPLVARISHERRLTNRLAVALGLIVALGIIGTFFQV